MGRDTSPRRSFPTASRIDIGTNLLNLVQRGAGDGQNRENVSRALPRDQMEGAAQASTAGTTDRAIQSNPEARVLSTTRSNGSADPPPSKSHELDSSQKDDQLLFHLSKCAEAVASLSSRIEEVTELWRYKKQYEPDCIAPSFKEARHSLKRLRNFESTFETPNKKQRVGGDTQATIKSTTATTSRKDSATPEPTAKDPDLQLLNWKEHASLKRFEKHATSCRKRGNVYRRYKKGQEICADGAYLAGKVSSKICYSGGGHFCALQRRSRPIYVQLGSEYLFAIDLLIARARYGEPGERRRLASDMVVTHSAGRVNNTYRDGGVDARRKRPTRDERINVYRARRAGRSPQPDRGSSTRLAGTSSSGTIGKDYEADGILTLVAPSRSGTTGPAPRGDRGSARVNADPLAAGGRYRNQRQGHPPAVLVNVFSDVVQSDEADIDRRSGRIPTPPYYQRARCPSPRYTQRGRGDRLGRDLTNEMVDPTLGIRRLRSRSQSRFSDGSSGGESHRQPRHKEARTRITELGTQRDRSDSPWYRSRAPYSPYPATFAASEPDFASSDERSEERRGSNAMRGNSRHPSPITRLPVARQYYAHEPNAATPTHPEWRSSQRTRRRSGVARDAAIMSSFGDPVDVLACARGHDDFPAVDELLRSWTLLDV